MAQTATCTVHMRKTALGDIFRELVNFGGSARHLQDKSPKTGIQTAEVLRVSGQKILLGMLLGANKSDK